MSSKPTIAIYGTSGALGKPVIDALTSPEHESKIAYPVRLITRSVKDKIDTSKVNYVEAGDSVSLIKAFSGADVVINLTGAHADNTETEKAVVASRPKLYIPSQFGCEIDKIDLFPNFLTSKTEHSETVRKNGIKTVDVITGFFEFPGSWLHEIVQHAGVNPETKTVTYRGDPNAKFAYTNLNDIGKAVAVVATSKNYSSLPDKVRIFSGLTSQKEIADIYSKSHNVDLTTKHIGDEEVLIEAKENSKNGIDFTNFFYYLQALISQGAGKGVLFAEDERELVNPGETNFKWTTIS